MHTYYLVRSSHNALVVMHQLPYVTSFWSMTIFLQTRYEYYQVDNMKQLFQDISVDNIMMFRKEINLFNKI